MPKKTNKIPEKEKKKVTINDKISVSSDSDSDSSDEEPKKKSLKSKNEKKDKNQVSNATDSLIDDYKPITDEHQLIFDEGRRGKIQINEYVLEDEKKKKEIEERIQKKKEVIPDLFYIVFYNMFVNYTKTGTEIIGVFNSRYLAEKACEYEVKRFGELFKNNKDVLIECFYTDFCLNHLYDAMNILS